MVATTRAETMLGDTAVAVHPDDPRYAHLVGREVELPLSGRRIPVVADPHVDPEFGTGAVKVTPAHDPDDFEIGRRHDLPSLTIMDERGVITAHGPFEGLDRFEARPAVRRRAARAGPDRRRAPPLRARGRALLPVRHDRRAAAVAAVVRQGRARWPRRPATRSGTAGSGIHPAEMAGRYFDWVDDMHDWCISRQLWWGHRIPVWYGPGGEVRRASAPDEEPPAGEGWTQDPDVLDTWFSSALWPFSTLGWPDDTEDLRALLPDQRAGHRLRHPVLLGRPDDDVRPVRDGATATRPTRCRSATSPCTAWSATQYGKKMSKSRGNTVDPLDWIDRFGADATRFTLARGASPGGDVAVSEDWVTGARNFCNKLWNATRFALLNGADRARTPCPRPRAWPPRTAGSCPGWPRSPPRWTSCYEQFEFGKICEALYHFAWDEVCDWYLELAKPALSGAGRAGRAGHPRGARLRARPAAAAAPPGDPVRHRGAVDGADRRDRRHDRRLAGRARPARAAGAAAARDPAAEAEIGALMRLVTEVRRFRSDQGLRPGQPVPAVLAGIGGTPLAAHEAAIRVAAAADRTRRRLHARPRPCTPRGVTVELDTAATIDVAAERRRMEKDLAAARKEADQAERKLANDAFLAKAPGRGGGQDPATGWQPRRPTSPGSPAALAALSRREARPAGPPAAARPRPGAAQA